jgi:dihydrofolate reductase
VQINLIAACDLDGAIGHADGRLPFSAPADMARFKRLTTGRVVVMGAATFRSLNRPAGLPNRTNVVVTRAGGVSESAHVFPEGDLLAYLRRVRAEDGDAPVWVIGGAQVYQQAITADLVDEIHLTVVHVHSGARVLIPHHLETPDRFIRAQGFLGRHWAITSVEPADVSDLPDHPPLTFVTLTRSR